jgi:hypothetical protein
MDKIIGAFLSWQLFADYLAYVLLVRHMVGFREAVLPTLRIPAMWPEEESGQA